MTYQYNTHVVWPKDATVILTNFWLSAITYCANCVTSEVPQVMFKCLNEMGQRAFSDSADERYATDHVHVVQQSSLPKQDGCLQLACWKSLPQMSAKMPAGAMQNCAIQRIRYYHLFYSLP